MWALLWFHPVTESKFEQISGGSGTMEGGRVQMEGVCLQGRLLKCIMALGPSCSCLFSWLPCATPFFCLFMDLKEPEPISPRVEI